MKRWQYCMGVLLASTLAGCLLPEATPTSSWWRQVQSQTRVAGPDVVYLEYATIEQPLATPYLNEGVWQTTDEQILPLRTRSLLNEHGFRVGLVGIVPSPLQALLTSEGTCRHPRAIQQRAGYPTAIPLNGEISRCTLRLPKLPGSGPEPARELQAADFAFHIVPEQEAEQRIRLSITPQVRHGQPEHWVVDASGERRWSPVGERPIERFERLSFSVSVAPHEYLLIGTEVGRRNTLGHHSLIALHGDNPQQRLLVVRAWSAHSLPATHQGSHSSGMEGAPLAQQAGRAVVRGASPQR